MTDRTYGETQDCAGCRYWSEMIAQCNGGPVEAMCIAPVGSPKRVGYTTGRETCTAWASGHLGAIDEPGQDPHAYEWQDTAPDTPGPWIMRCAEGDKDTPVDVRLDKGVMMATDPDCGYLPVHDLHHGLTNTQWRPA